ncbi:MAG: heterodisulfide reductase [Chloroflexales bacterium]|nr:heterodisulfide reductase [Chloroflexales bacterium]
MTIMIRAGGGPDELLHKVEALSGQSLFGCYQCGTCAAGCPFYEAMDLLPDALIRHLTLGLPGVLERRTIWICVGCESCVERCPRAIDVARVMEALRQIRLQEGGDQLAVAQLQDEALRELPPIAIVASLRRHTG